MIQTIYYSTLKTLGRVLTLSDQIYEIVSKAHPDDPFLSGVMIALAKAIAMGRLAVGSPRGEMLTEEVTTSRELRANNFIGLRQFIEALSRLQTKPENQEGCQRLLAIFNQNDRTLYRLGYSEQTAALESLFQDLNTDQSRADLAAIGATKWLEKLKDSHESFKAAYARRGQERADNPIPTDAEALEELKPATDNLCIMLNAVFLNQQLENINQTVSLVNEAIERAQNAAQKVHYEPVQLTDSDEDADNSEDAEDNSEDEAGDASQPQNESPES